MVLFVNILFDSSVNLSGLQCCVYDLVVVYDVTRRETFDNLSDVWAKEVELYSTNKECVKMLIGNKVDRVSFFLPSSGVLKKQSQIKCLHHRFPKICWLMLLR